MIGSRQKATSQGPANIGGSQMNYSQTMPQLNYTQHDIREQYMAVSSSANTNEPGANKGRFRAQSSDQKGWSRGGEERPGAAKPLWNDNDERDSSVTDINAAAGGHESRTRSRFDDRKRARRSRSASIFSSCFHISTNITQQIPARRLKILSHFGLASGSNTNTTNNSNSNNDTHQKSSNLRASKTMGHLQQYAFNDDAARSTNNDIDTENDWPPSSAGQSRLRALGGPGNSQVTPTQGSRKHVSFGGKQQHQQQQSIVSSNNPAPELNNPNNNSNYLQDQSMRQQFNCQSQQQNHSASDMQQPSALGPVSSTVIIRNYQANIRDLSSIDGQSENYIYNNNNQQAALQSSREEPVSKLFGGQPPQFYHSAQQQQQHQMNSIRYQQQQHQQQKQEHQFSGDGSVITRQPMGRLNQHHSFNTMDQQQNKSQLPSQQAQASSQTTTSTSTTTITKSPFTSSSSKRTAPAIPMRTQATQTDITAYHLMLATPSSSAGSTLHRASVRSASSSTATTTTTTTATMVKQHRANAQSSEIELDENSATTTTTITPAVTDPLGTMSATESDRLPAHTRLAGKGAPAAIGIQSNSNSTDMSSFRMGCELTSEASDATAANTTETETAGHEHRLLQSRLTGEDAALNFGGDSAAESLPAQKGPRARSVSGSSSNSNASCSDSSLAGHDSALANRLGLFPSNSAGLGKSPQAARVPESGDDNERDGKKTKEKQKKGKKNNNSSSSGNDSNNNNTLGRFVDADVANNSKTYPSSAASAQMDRFATSNAGETTVPETGDKVTSKGKHGASATIKEQAKNLAPIDADDVAGRAADSRRPRCSADSISDDAGEGELLKSLQGAPSGDGNDVMAKICTSAKGNSNANANANANVCFGAGALDNKHEFVVSANMHASDLRASNAADDDDYFRALDPPSEFKLDQAARGGAIPRGSIRDDEDEQTRARATAESGFDSQIDNNTNEQQRDINSASAKNSRMHRFESQPSLSEASSQTDASLAPNIENIGRQMSKSKSQGKTSRRAPDDDENVLINDACKSVSATASESSERATLGRGYKKLTNREEEAEDVDARSQSSAGSNSFRRTPSSVSSSTSIASSASRASSKSSLSKSSANPDRSKSGSSERQIIQRGHERRPASRDPSEPNGSNSSSQTLINETGLADLQASLMIDEKDYLAASAGSSKGAPTTSHRNNNNGVDANDSDDDLCELMASPASNRARRSTSGEGPDRASPTRRGSGSTGNAPAATASTGQSRRDDFLQLDQLELEAAAAAAAAILQPASQASYGTSPAEILAAVGAGPSSNLNGHLASGLPPISSQVGGLVFNQKQAVGPACPTAPTTTTTSRKVSSTSTLSTRHHSYCSSDELGDHHAGVHSLLSEEIELIASNTINAPGSSLVGAGLKLDGGANNNNNLDTVADDGDGDDDDLDIGIALDNTILTTSLNPGNKSTVENVQQQIARRLSGKFSENDAKVQLIQGLQIGERLDDDEDDDAHQNLDYARDHPFYSDGAESQGVVGISEQEVLEGSAQRRARTLGSLRKETLEGGGPGPEGTDAFGLIHGASGPNGAGFSGAYLENRFSEPERCLETAPRLPQDAPDHPSGEAEKLDSSKQSRQYSTGDGHATNKRPLPISNQHQQQLSAGAKSIDSSSGSAGRAKLRNNSLDQGAAAAAAAATRKDSAASGQSGVVMERGEGRAEGGKGQIESIAKAARLHESNSMSLAATESIDDPDTTVRCAGGAASTTTKTTTTTLTASSSAGSSFSSSGSSSAAGPQVLANAPANQISAVQKRAPGVGGPARSLADGGSASELAAGPEQLQDHERKASAGEGGGPLSAGSDHQKRFSNRKSSELSNSSFETNSASSLSNGGNSSKATIPPQQQQQQQTGASKTNNNENNQQQQHSSNDSPLTVSELDQDEDLSTPSFLSSYKGRYEQVYLLAEQVVGGALDESIGQAKGRGRAQSTSETSSPFRASQAGPSSRRNHSVAFSATGPIVIDELHEHAHSAGNNNSEDKDDANCNSISSASSRHDSTTSGTTIESSSSSDTTSGATLSTSSTSVEGRERDCCAHSSSSAAAAAATKGPKHRHQHRSKQQVTLEQGRPHHQLGSSDDAAPASSTPTPQILQQQQQQQPRPALPRKPAHLMGADKQVDEQEARVAGADKQQAAASSSQEPEAAAAIAVTATTIAAAVERHSKTAGLKGFGPLEKVSAVAAAPIATTSHVNHDNDSASTPTQTHSGDFESRPEQAPTGSDHHQRSRRDGSRSSEGKVARNKTVKIGATSHYDCEDPDSMDSANNENPPSPPGPSMDDEASKRHCLVIGSTRADSTSSPESVARADLVSRSSSLGSTSDASVVLATRQASATLKKQPSSSKASDPNGAIQPVNNAKKILNSPNGHQLSLDAGSPDVQPGKGDVKSVQFVNKPEVASSLSAGINNDSRDAAAAAPSSNDSNQNNSNRLERKQHTYSLQQNAIATNLNDHKTDTNDNDNQRRQLQGQNSKDQGQVGIVSPEILDHHKQGDDTRGHSGGGDDRVCPSSVIGEAESQIPSPTPATVAAGQQQRRSSATSTNTPGSCSSSSKSPVDCPYVHDLLIVCPNAGESPVKPAPTFQPHSARLTHDDTMEAIEDDVEGEELEQRLLQQQDHQLISTNLGSVEPESSSSRDAGFFPKSPNPPPGFGGSQDSSGAPERSITPADSLRDEPEDDLLDLEGPSPPELPSFGRESSRDYHQGTGAEIAGPDYEEEDGPDDDDEESSVSVSHRGVLVSAVPAGGSSVASQKQPSSPGSSSAEQRDGGGGSPAPPIVRASGDLRPNQSSGSLGEWPAKSMSNESGTQAILDHLALHQVNGTENVPAQPPPPPPPQIPDAGCEPASVSNATLTRRTSWRQRLNDSPTCGSQQQDEERNREASIIATQLLGSDGEPNTATMKRRKKKSLQDSATTTEIDGQVKKNKLMTSESLETAQGSQEDLQEICSAKAADCDTKESIVDVADKGDSSPANQSARRGPPLSQLRTNELGNIAPVSTSDNNNNNNYDSICSSCSCRDGPESSSITQPSAGKDARPALTSTSGRESPVAHLGASSASTSRGQHKPQQHSSGNSNNSQWISQEEGTVFTENYWLSHWLYISELEEAETWRHAIDMNQVGVSTSSSTAAAAAAATATASQYPDESLISGLPKEMDEMRSTSSENNFNSKYKSTTRKMIHRRATIEMYRRIQEQRLAPEKRVEINRSNGEFGFRIHGSRPVVVSAIEKGTSAESCGLEVGDLIYAINGVNILDMAHSDVVRLAHNAQSSSLVLDLIPTNDFLGSRKYNRSINKCHEPTLTGFLVRLSPTTAQPLLVELQKQLSLSSGVSTQQRVAKLTRVLRLAWRRRYFVLRSDNCLYWFKSMNDIEPQGGINLQGFSATITNEFSEPAYVIRLIKYGGQPHYFGTNKLADIEQWIDAINRAATEANQNDPYMGRTLKLARLMPQQIDEPDCASYLYKYSRKRDGGAHWKPVYFVLKDACLYLFRNGPPAEASMQSTSSASSSTTTTTTTTGHRDAKADNCPAAAISPSGQASAVVYLHGYRVRSKQIERKRHTFELIPPTRKTMRPIFLMASSEIEKKRWIAALEYTIDRWIEID